MPTPAPFESNLVSSGRRVPVLLVSLSLFLAAPAGAVPGPPETDPSPFDLLTLPVVDRFLSPVGGFEDYTAPAVGETRGYTLVRGLRHGKRRHQGLDLSNQRSGGEVRAPADGVVLEVGRRGAWGNLVVIAHRLPGHSFVVSLLAHLKTGSMQVRKGDPVRAGQVVGAVGRTGRATGPHLHYELRRLGHVNPWEHAWMQGQVLDPGAIFGLALGDGFRPGGGREEHWGWAYLQKVSGVGSDALGDPDAPLSRREFYAWVARASGKRVTRLTSWSRIRQSLAHLGLEEIPTEVSAARATVAAGEALRALLTLATYGRLERLPEREAIADEQLARRALPRLEGFVQAEPDAAGAAAERSLTRAEGALLVLAARSHTAVATAMR